MNKIYFVSGLGADHRVFEFLEVPYPYQHIKWISPEKNDTIGSYSSKLISQIDTANEIILIGVSFGGMICQEIARRIRCKKVIILSSVKSCKEFNWQLQLIRKTRLDKIFPTFLIKTLNIITANYYFGVKSKNESILLRKIIEETDWEFSRWAIGAIMSWKNEEPYSPIVHLHGTDDKIFPSRNITDFIKIEKGGHFMIVTKAKEISKIIYDVIVVR